MTALLQIRELRCNVGRRDILRGIDLRLDEGQRVALLGRNGAGKTTLLRAIAGRQTIQDGAIEIKGFPAGSSQARALIGVIPQRLALFPRLSVKENIQAFAALNGVTSSGQTQATLEFTGLSNRQNDLVVNLSGGMQRRLSIGCGAIHRPALLLADEPLVGVDHGHRKPIDDLLSSLCEQGTTVVETTHELEHVAARHNIVVVMEKGRVAYKADVNDMPHFSPALSHRCEVLLEEVSTSTPSIDSFQWDGRKLSGSLNDVAQELPQLLEQLSCQNLKVVNIRIQPPGVDELISTLGPEC